MQEVIALMKQRKIPVLFAANYFSRAQIQQVAARTGAKPVIVPENTGGAPGVDTYFDLMNTWVTQLAAAFARGRLMDLSLFLPPLAACLVIVAIHSYLGLHVLAREVIFVDLSLAQMAALGSAVAILAGSQPDSRMAFGYALAFTTLGAALFAMTRSDTKGRVPQEAIIGIVYVVASAAAILVADRTPRGGEAIKDILVGSLLWVTWPTILRLAAVYAAVGLFHWVLRKRFLTISFHPERAVARGWRIRWWDFLVLPVVRRGDHLLGADRGRAAGLLVPRGAGRDRVPVHPAYRQARAASRGARERSPRRSGSGSRSTTTCRRGRWWCACSGCCCWRRTWCGGRWASRLRPRKRRWARSRPSNKGGTVLDAAPEKAIFPCPWVICPGPTLRARTP